MRPTTQTLPSVTTWNLSIQRQLTNNMTLDMAYIGSAGRHGFAGDGSGYQLNPVNIQNFNVPGISQDQRRYYYNKFSYPGYIDPSTGQTLMCCGGAGDVMGNYLGNSANSNYNALQVKLQQNMAHGLQFIAHYTWSRSLHYDSNYYAANPAVAYGPDDQNRNQVFVFNAVYQLPFGKGKAFGGGAGKAENYVIGGWQVSATTNWSSGLPFTPGFANCGMTNDVGVCRPNVGNQALWSMGGGSFNPITHSVTFFTPISTMTTPGASYGAWNMPQVGTIGNSGFDYLYGVRSFTTDASIMKNFGLTERFNLIFRMDAFNLFNHPVYGFSSTQGNTCIDCGGNAGLIQSLDANVAMRALQFALKLSF
jgi:hypothetical protein